MSEKDSSVVNSSVVSNLSKEERDQFGSALCQVFQCSPGHIFDGTMFAMFRTYYVDPQKVEKFLEHRGQSVKDDESLYDKIAELYGDGVAKMMQDLI